MKTQTIKQTAFIPAKPEEVYHALVDSEEYTKFTGAKATFNPKVGGQFTA